MVQSQPWSTCRTSSRLCRGEAPLATPEPDLSAEALLHTANDSRIGLDFSSVPLCPIQ